MGVSNGGVSRSRTCPSFFVLFWDFPNFSGIFPIYSGMVRKIFRDSSLFLFLGLLRATYEEQSRKGPRHNLDLSRKKVGNTQVWKHPGLASLKKCVQNLFSPRRSAGVAMLTTTIFPGERRKRGRTRRGSYSAKGRASAF